MKISGYMFVAGLFAVLVFVAGCGGDTGMGYVTGRMTLNGDPVPAGVRITFAPTGPGNSSSSTGITRQDGTFEMDFSFTKKGVMVGNCSVRFEVRSDSEDTGRDQPKFKIPQKYRDSYGEEITVKPGKQVLNFDLTSD